MRHRDNDHTRARIIRASRILGGEGDEICRHCDVSVFLFPHADDCLLRKVNPEALKKTMNDVRIKAKKEINKQRIFRSDKKRWSGLPSGGGTLVKRKGARAKKNTRNIKWCRVCTGDRLFINNKCRECEHARPCNYSPDSENCPRCHPSEK